ncbi:hypothetical protein BGHDH14_bgh04327 [Blumeria hordei DH14]|uniref:Defect at low temperature protein 1 n=1 Tax=Blumeria graminis f. sp. hordei (strain DH14) TaxID=546991 RepID=N1J7W9_BLUG1|nr:hypothetical protein BGHDH14_bgh04327 [Blumeria hordei DH14]
MKFHIIFRWFYVGFYGFLHILLAVLLLVTPGDAIHQALENNQLYNVFVIAGVYLLTLLLTITLYATRLYTDNIILKAIPKTWIPVDKGDVSKKVRNMITAGLDRSAMIALIARPRIQLGSVAAVPATKRKVSIWRKPSQADNISSELELSQTRPDSVRNEQAVAEALFCSTWGNISHDGWSSPMSLDVPNLHYITVISELPYLIEAKAVSISTAGADSNPEQTFPDVRTLEILQRPISMSVRDYVGYLIYHNVVTSPDAANQFLPLYEYARFSDNPLNEREFRELMAAFTDLLRSMDPLDPKLLSNEYDHWQSDIDNDNASSIATRDLNRSQSSLSFHSNISHTDSEGTIQLTWIRDMKIRGNNSKRPYNLVVPTASYRGKSHRLQVFNSNSEDNPKHKGSYQSSLSVDSDSQQSIVVRNDGSIIKGVTINGG